MNKDQKRVFADLGTRCIGLRMLGGLVAISAALGAGCDDGSTRLDKAWDCHQICDQVKTCVGGEDFDMGDCKNACKEDASDEAVDDCENCLDDEQSCADGVGCAEACAGVVAESVFD